MRREREQMYMTMLDEPKPDRGPANLYEEAFAWCCVSIPLGVGLAAVWPIVEPILRSFF